ncbi:hypothetical protein CB0940_06409 [Cercospora beticola]|uniref:Uncharacterized protein n=1 Tax=Cercospora beticola TaxID=122368 RepID=A0A2G5HYE7_CERBT|nr:hypothetical protein CB0940_06409 [Cercospora beticola]PIA97559.1 hypothetical protein CB0940_06409 [Cercospora beticola]WPA99041.1 hypothetical protein RHO25_003655 [Cercospora beticola]
MSQQEQSSRDQEGHESSASISYHDAEHTGLRNQPRRPADHTFESIMEGLSTRIRSRRGNQMEAGPNVPPMLITEADRNNRSAVGRIVRRASQRIQRVLPPGTRHLRRRMRTIEANMYEMLVQRSNSVRRNSYEAWHLRPPHQQGWDYNSGWPECYSPTVRPDASEILMRYRGHPYSCEGRQESGQLPENNAGEPEMERFSTMHRAPPLVRRRPSPRPTLRLQAPNGMPPVFTPDGLTEDTAVRDSVEDRFRVSSSQYGAIGPTTSDYEHYTNIERREPAHPVEHWQSFTSVENSSFGGSTLQSTNDSGYNSYSASAGTRYSNATIDRPGNNYAVQRHPEPSNQTGGAATTPAEYNTPAQSFGQAYESYPQRRASPVSLPPISAIMQGNAAMMESASNSETAAVSDDPQTESDYVLDSGTGLFHVSQPTPIDLLTQPVDASTMYRYYTGPSDGEQSGRGYAGTPRTMREQHYRST